ncbi:MAG: FAD-dependent oxidoreductase [Neomegalonema sp.]|nr:FAD-dependent oxidoreductase [Neomegalonema sp.]
MKIAVIGAGISGLGAALALSESHDVQLFERDARFGGHACTVNIDYEGENLPVDVGFIVYNEKNYPNLTRLFDHLGVATEDSDMSFGVSMDGGRLEYACDNLDKIFAQRWRIFDPSAWRLFYDILRFNKRAPEALASGALDGLSLGQWLDAHRFSRLHRERFLYPMGGAIWSMASEAIEHFPARNFVQFFANHELMTGLDSAIQWRTVTGGSRHYVEKVLQHLGPRAHCGIGVRSLHRAGGQVTLSLTDGSEAVFDKVVIAAHSDQALQVLSDADAQERALLGAIRYAPNTAVLHRDESFMPRRRKVWSSWSVEVHRSGAAQNVPTLSYWMNRLQNLPQDKPLFVTLNPQREVDPEREFARFSFAHPQFDAAAFNAQAEMDEIQGRGGVHYAGAWLGWGFHEDGLASGLHAAALLGARPAWSASKDAPRRSATAIAAE